MASRLSASFRTNSESPRPRARRAASNGPSANTGTFESLAQWRLEHGRNDQAESRSDERERRIFNNAVIDLYARRQQSNSRRRAS